MKEIFVCKIPPNLPLPKGGTIPLFGKEGLGSRCLEESQREVEIFLIRSTQLYETLNLSAAARATAFALFPRHTGTGQFINEFLFCDFSVSYSLDFGEQYVIQVYGGGLRIRSGLFFGDDYDLNFKVPCRASSGSGIVPSPASGRVVIDEF